MKTISKKDWFLLVVYGFTLAFVLVTAAATEAIGEETQESQAGKE